MPASIYLASLPGKYVCVFMLKSIIISFFALDIGRFCPLCRWKCVSKRLLINSIMSILCSRVLNPAKRESTRIGFVSTLFMQDFLLAFLRGFTLPRFLSTCVLHILAAAHLSGCLVLGVLLKTLIRVLFSD